MERATPEEFAEARRRTLRRHAIETGIIERLYAVSWRVTELSTEAAALAAEVSSRIAAYMEQLGQQLEATFAEVDPDTRHRVYSATPPDERAKWWFAQLVRAARQVDIRLPVVGLPTGASRAMDVRWRVSCRWR